MTRHTQQDTKNTETPIDYTVPQASTVPEAHTNKTQDDKMHNERVQGNGKSRRSVEGPEDYISHDTDDLK
jgi:hypothetical protein